MPRPTSPAGGSDALASVGSTGAAMAAATFGLRRLHGVQRPALAVRVPVPGKPVLFLDVGANVVVRPQHLVQFAFLGAAFSEAVLGVERPRVGLLSVGEEAGKGSSDVVAAHDLLSKAHGIEFIGNVEGRDIPEGAADVIVTDGFTGNISLKLMEGTARTVTAAIRDAARSSPMAAAGGLLMRQALPRCAGSSTRTPPAARSSSACGGSPWSVTAAPAPRGSPTCPPRRPQRRGAGDRADLGAARGGRGDPRLPRGGGGRRDRNSPMTREEVTALVREHLAEELEVEIERITEQSRFKEDLDADSLDLYELVMELEDRYGVSVPEEDAARIETVGDAVDFVLQHAPA